MPLLVMVVGCRADDDDVRGGAGEFRLPRLELAVVHNTFDGPGSTHTQIVAGDSGGILFHPQSGSGHALAVLDRDGTVSYIGGEGEGPGEARMPLGLELGPTRVSAFDLSTHRVLEWSRDGRVMESWRPPSTAIPFTRVPGRGVLAVRSRSEGLFPALLLDQSGTARDMVAPTDTFYQRIFPAERTATDRLTNPTVIGRWSGGSLIADGLTYQIGLYDWNGRLVRVIHRDLGPNLRNSTQVEAEIGMLRRTGRRDESWLARERDRLANTAIRWFNHLGPPAPDGRGRLWVVGQHQDGGFADVFQDGAFLGRLSLECEGFAGRWSITGEWLALMCAPDDPASSRDAVVKLYRVVD